MTCTFIIIGSTLLAWYITPVRVESHLIPTALLGVIAVIVDSILLEKQRTTNATDKAYAQMGRLIFERFSKEDQ